MKRTALLLLLLTLAWNAQAQTARSNLYTIFGFEKGSLSGWSGGPFATMFVDNQVVHSGRYSARIQRDGASANAFSTLTECIPADFVGTSLDWKGYFKTEDVDGFAALWMRVDGETSTLAFATLQDLQLAGTRDWEQYTISVPVALDARQVCFGFLLDGAGKAWVDDLEMYADGINISSTATKQNPLTLDHQFDQGSGIHPGSLSDVQIDNLYTLGKVWGFLKYHHPVVTAGQRHWDYDLMRILPQVLNASDHDSANEALAAWIDNVGSVPGCTSCVNLTYGNLTLSPDLDWIRDAGVLGTTLSQKLQDVYKNRKALTKQFYVSLANSVSNPVFDSELTYAGISLPDSGFQLLALFRFWNAVQYFYPYRDVMADDSADSEYWNRVLKESIAPIALALNAPGYQQELIRLIAKVHDTHANLWSSLSARPPLGLCQFPVDVRFVEGQPIVVRLLSGNNIVLQPGDIIEKMDGVPVDDLVNQWRPLYADSNEAARLRDIGMSMTQGPCGTASVVVQRGDNHVSLFAVRVPSNTLNLSLRSTHDLPGATFQKLADDIGYLKLSSVVAANSASYIRSAAGTKGLIIDLRNYPSEFVVFTLGQLLVSDTTEFTRFTYGDPINPGAFHLRTSTLLVPQEPHYSGKVVILIDEITQSQAEYTTMAFRTAPGAIVIGSTTAGADGNVSAIALPGALSTEISGLGVFYPDGRPTQRVGIIPDIEVRPTIAGIRAGRDELIEEAVRQIRLSDSGTGLGTAFTLNGPATVSLQPRAESSILSVGYASIQPQTTAPSGLAIFSLRQNDVLVSEAGVPASPAIQSGRLAAEMSGAVKTGLAIANPNNQRTTISFYFTDENGNLGSGSTIVEGKSQISAFLDQAPFHGKAAFDGSFTFASTLPVAVVALRGLTNVRGEFLITTMPVGNLSASPATALLVFPHYADGGGWTTQLVLTNPSDTTLTGAIEFRDPAGTLKANSGLTYSIPPRGSQKLQTQGSAVAAQVGSVRVIPAAGTAAPFAVSIFSFKKDGVTVSEAGVPAIAPSTAFRLYVESDGDFRGGAVGSRQSGIAVANLSGSAAAVTLELFSADGSSTGLKGTLTIPPNGQTAGFLNGLPGFTSMPAAFQGTLRVSSSAPVSVIGLRGRYNERLDFLMTTTPPTNEAVRGLESPMYFPLVAIGAGYSTQFILFGGSGSSSAGLLSVFAQSGALLNLAFQ